MDKLGFTFYPRDWWTSDTYFNLEPLQRYIYLEILFLIYLNDGILKNQKTQIENRLRTKIQTEDWELITSTFVVDEDGNLTHPSVNKRLKKAITARENGKKGGRPRKEEADEETQKTHEENPKKPTLEREREREREKEIEEEEESKTFETSPPLSMNTKDFNSKLIHVNELKEELKNERFKASHQMEAKRLGVDFETYFLAIDTFTEFLLNDSTKTPYKTMNDFRNHLKSWLNIKVQKGDLQSVVITAAKPKISNDPNTPPDDSGKWIFLNNRWIDKNNLTAAQKKRYGIN